MMIKGLPAGTFFTPQLPLSVPRVPATFPTTPTTTVSDFTGLQNAVNAASAGDVIAVNLGTYTGNLVLPAHAGTTPIYIISANLSSLPAFGNRVSPADAVNMPKLVGTGSPQRAITTTGVANNWRIVGLEIACASSGFSTTLINMGSGSETSESQLPTGIVFDRCYVHGDPTLGGRRGFNFACTDSAVVHCYISDFKEEGADSQAFLMLQGARILFWNNYAEGAGENIILGGGDPSIKGARPTDLTIVGNHFAKPLSWMGSIWSVKNLWESKNSNRVLLAYNTFENIWPAAQSGYALNIKSANQDGTAPWSGTFNLTVLYNHIKNAANGIVLSASDEGTSGPTTNVLFQHNLIEVTLLQDTTPAEGRLIMCLGGLVNAQFDHITAILTVAPTGTCGEYIDALGGVMTGFNITNSIFSAGDFGFDGPGASEGTPTLNLQAGARWTFNKTAMIASPGGSGAYPAGNFFPANAAAMNFVNLAGGNYGLTSTSPGWQAATDGSNIGCNYPAVAQFSAQAIAGNGMGVY